MTLPAPTSLAAYLKRAALFATVTGCAPDEVYLTPRDQVEIIDELKPLFAQTAQLVSEPRPGMIGIGAGFTWFVTESILNGSPKFWCASQMGPCPHMPSIKRWD